MADLLVAENVTDIRDALARIFRRHGHTLRLTDNGLEALHLALDAPPDLLIMNPALPGMHGLDVCRRLRAEARTEGLPILMLSVHQFPAEKAAARQAGADDYLGKPFTNDELLARVRALLDRGGAPTEAAATPVIAMTE